MPIPPCYRTFLDGVIIELFVRLNRNAFLLIQFKYKSIRETLKFKYSHPARVRECERIKMEETEKMDRGKVVEVW